MRRFRADYRPSYTTVIATNDHPRIFVSAGEASGDHYGAQIIAGLRARLPQATFTGLGGAEMEAAGQQCVVRAEDVAHMGITEVLRHAPRVYASYRRLVGALQRERPALAVLIDFPDVNFRLAKHCKRLGVPVLWFVSPQLWAWKRKRLRWVQQRVDRMLVIFPFEETFYRARGVDAEFVGHPLATMGMPVESREEYAKKATQISQDQWNWVGPDIPVQIERGTKLGEIRYEIDPHKPWIALLPGSRGTEIGNHLRTMIGAACEIGSSYEFIVPIAPTITERQLAVIQYETGDLYLGGMAHSPRITFVRDARAALYHSRAAVVASGTATVQALTIGNPFVVVYRVSGLTYALAKRLVRYPKEIAAETDVDGNLPIAMPNLIAGRRIVPELINDRFTAENVAAALRPLLEDTPERARMMACLSEARGRLLRMDEMGEAAGDPIGRVCEAAAGLIRGQ